MNNNDFQQYGFDHYDQIPLQQRGLLERMFGPRVANTMKSPLMTTAAFLVVGVAFASFVVSSYSGGDDQADAPVVKADTLAFKHAPNEPGGMDIRHLDSTVFMSMNDETASESAPIENLLEDAALEQAAAELESFSQQVDEIASVDEAMGSEASVRKVENLLENSAVEAGEKIAVNTIATPDALAPAPSQKPVGAGATSNDAVLVDQSSLSVAAADVQSETSRVAPPSMPIVHSAGSNPETLAFVRDVLDKKDGRVAANAMPTTDHTASAASPSAASVAAIQPAAGSQAAAGIMPGSYFVQLASVTSASGAAGEWGKLQGVFPAQLSGMDHRVKAADLGERGVYYRIQAGPMSKDSANALCGEIKAQKPGGCLVTK